MNAIGTYIEVYILQTIVTLCAYLLLACFSIKWPNLMVQYSLFYLPYVHQLNQAIRCHLYNKGWLQKIS